jgi:hypothetical protein
MPRPANGVRISMKKTLLASTPLRRQSAETWRRLIKTFWWRKACFSVWKPSQIGDTDDPYNITVTKPHGTEYGIHGSVQESRSSSCERVIILCLCVFFRNNIHANINVRWVLSYQTKLNWKKTLIKPQYPASHIIYWLLFNFMEISTTML